MTTAISHDVVSVFTYGRGDHRAECSCGWQAKQRILKGHATYDAYMHAGREGCRDNDPMVWDSRDYRPTDAPSWRERVRAVLWLTGAFSIVTIGAIVVPVPAHADPITDLTMVEFAFVNTFGQTLCDQINKHATTAGVVGVRQAVMGEGFTDGEAQTILSASAEAYCPARFQLVQSSASVPGISPVVKS